MKNISVYIHFPWCLKKCGYCDFVSFAEERSQILHQQYADSILTEIRLRATAFNACIQSIFFGGGTPSLWHSDQIGRVIHCVKEHSSYVSPTLEVTVECNPTSIDRTKANELAAVGVTRLSIGVQGLHNDRLQFLERLHDKDLALRAVTDAVESKISHVNADFMYGIATESHEQSIEEVVNEVTTLCQTGIDHLSAYNLTIEPGTLFGERARKGQLPMFPEKTMVESFFAIESILEPFGFHHYEISNYAKRGCETIHNLNYWYGTDYVGLGCAAYGTLSSSEGAIRYRNKTHPTSYMSDLANLSLPIGSTETLDRETLLRERIMLGLRLRAGFNLENEAKALGIDPWPSHRQKAAEKLVRQKRLQINGSRLSIPAEAWIFADGIAAELF